jgi:hypothetical protein
MTDISSLSNSDLMELLKKPQNGGSSKTSDLSSLSDDELMQQLNQKDDRVHAKNLSEAPAAIAQNLPASAAEFGSNLYNAVTHPLNTLGDIADVAAGGVRAGAKAILPESVFNAMDVNTPVPLPINFTKEDAAQKAGAVGQNLANRYGSLSQAADTAVTDPIGAVADASSLLLGPEMIAGRAPGVVGSLARASGSVGSAIDPIANAARLAKGTANFAGNRAANALGLSTGVGTDAIKAAYQSGEGGKSAFLDAINGNSNAKAVVNDADKGALNIRKQAGQGYVSDMAGLGVPTSALDLSPVQKTVADSESIFKNPNTGFVKNEAAQSTLNDIKTKITDWQKTVGNSPTITDFDDLKQSIGEIRDSVAPGSRAFRVADNVYGSIADEIGSKVPGYTDAMSNYSNNLNNYQQLRQTMSLKGPNTNVDTAARKLLSGLRDNVNTNFGQRKAMLDQLNQQNPNLIPTLAGLSLSSATPRGLAAHVASAEGMMAALHNPALLLGLPLTSPRLMGYGAYGAGRAAGLLQPAAKLAPSAQMLNLAQQANRYTNPGLLGQ